MRDSWTVLATSALLAVFVAACGSETNVPAPDVPVEIEEAAAPLRLYVFDCGTLLVDDVGMFNLSEEEAGTHELFVPCYLVEHPQGRLLWELGLPLGVITGEYTLPGGSMTLERSLEDQLADIGVEKSDIDWVAVSHLHFDHCGQSTSTIADRSTNSRTGRSSCSEQSSKPRWRIPRRFPSTNPRSTRRWRTTS
jgi:hypothetical protein